MAGVGHSEQDVSGQKASGFSVVQRLPERGGREVRSHQWLEKGRDRPEGPESSRREAFFKLWESGKIKRPEHTAGGSQNKGAEKLQRRAAHPRWGKEAGGRGKGQTQPQRSHPLPHWEQAPGSYLKTS